MCVCVCVCEGLGRAGWSTVIVGGVLWRPQIVGSVWREAHLPASPAVCSAPQLPTPQPQYAALICIAWGWAGWGVGG